MKLTSRTAAVDGRANFAHAADVHKRERNRNIWSQWLHSHVTADKTFCIYLAEDEAAIHEHAKISGFPASVISEVACIIDPTSVR